MKFWTRGLIVILAVLGLSACYPESRYPLSDPENSIVDDALKGLWYGGEPEDPGEHAYYAFLKTAPEHFDIIGISFNGDKDEWIRMRALTTEIGGGKFMSITFRDESGDDLTSGEEAEEDEEPLYLLCRYEIGEDGKLRVYLIDERAMKAALAEDAEAAANGNWVDDDGRITAPTEILRRAILAGDPQELFGESLGVYERKS